MVLWQVCVIVGKVLACIAWCNWFVELGLLDGLVFFDTLVR